VRHIEAGKEAAIEAEMQASRERAVVPLETRVQQFMEMLAEKEVNYSFIVVCQLHCVVQLSLCTVWSS